LRQCGRLETLRLSCSTPLWSSLGPDGARALAPALRNLGSLQNLEVDGCNIQDVGATAILKNLFNIPNLKYLSLSENGLSAKIMIPLTAYLNGPARRCLEVLKLYKNHHLFGRNATNYQLEPFYDALANHTAIQNFDPAREPALVCCFQE
jgi:Ran GTPase-activating protein (RanGAP) involved in mRNA processing and transport